MLFVALLGFEQEIIGIEVYKLVFYPLLVKFLGIMIVLNARYVRF